MPFKKREGSARFYTGLAFRIHEYRSLFNEVRASVESREDAKRHIDFLTAETKEEREFCRFKIVAAYLDKLKYRPKAEQAAGLNGLSTEDKSAFDNTVRSMLDYVNKPVQAEEPNVQG
jgi:hypothetical protein